MPRLELHLLGAPRIELNHRPIEVDTRKAIALLAYLALSGQGHTRQKLAALFWPEAETGKALAALRRTLSVLNKALGGVGLAIEREQVSLERSEQVWIDVEAFRERAQHPDLRALAEAAALYRDDFLAGFTLRDSPAFDDWQFFQSETLRRELAAVLEKLVRGLSARGDDGPAIEYARRWLALDPLHEPAHRALMQLYARTGQPAAALRQYRECARVLDAELGVAPLAETTQLYETIKNHRLPDPDQETPNLSPAAQGAGGAPPHAPSPVAPFPLVGRAAEKQRLLAAYRPGQLIVLEGEAGIGKTRLAEELLSAARRAGALTLTARCYAGQALAYGPIVEALRATLAQPEAAPRLRALPAHHRAEAARLLPELLTAPIDVPPLESPGAQSRFFEGVRQLLYALCTGPAPGVLLVDDAQWADEASLELLGYVVRRLREMPLAVVMTWRAEDVPPHHRLRALRAEAERSGAAHVLTLTRLHLADVRELVTASLAPQAQGPRDNGLIERLFHEAEGSPFFLVEYLNALSHTAASEWEADWPLPAGVRELLNTRLSTVSETGAQLLSAAAVIGRSFDLDTLQAVSGRGDDETVTALEELIARGLVLERETEYDFSHEKLRALVYDQTSLARRRRLYHRAAEALLARARRRGDLPAQSGQIAQHLQRGGDEAQAAQFYRRAGDHARSLYAHAEAIAHYQTALALGHPEAAALHEAIGDLLTLGGDYAGALQHYEAAAADETAALPELERKLANVYDRRGEWDLAERHFAAALTLLGETLDQSTPSLPESPEAAAVRARLFTDWSRTAHHRGHNQQAAALARRALALAETAGEARGLALAHNILGLIATRAEDYALARTHLEESLKLAEAFHDPDARVAALNNLALVCRQAGDPQRALRLTEEALALCASIGDRHREAALHNNLADLHYALGNRKATMDHLKQAVILFTEIGGEARASQPEIWKLTEW